MSVPTVLIDAANLHSGGGLQVAASFLDELAGLRRDPAVQAEYPWLLTLDVEATPEVTANLAPGTARELNVQEATRSPLDRQAWLAPPTHDVSFTVFGPAYGRRRGRHQIVGMADVTSIYSVPETSTGLSKKQQALRQVRRLMSRALFTRADLLVVEAPHVRSQLQTQWGYAPEQVRVVANCVNSVFRNASTAGSTERHGWIYVTRAYPHKNIDFLGRVGEALHARGVDDVTFKLTLTDEEWAGLSETTRRHCENLGAQRVEQLLALYAACEGSVFPSLLECFSAAPLEALYCGLPLVASDRAFVKDVCGSAALYADPRDPDAWADSIVAIRSEPATREQLQSAGRDVISHASDAHARAVAYLGLINEGTTSVGGR